ncbi:hypothetical protein R1sor_012112 [Riccia sorocarpa]|uniref:Glycosyltransferase n=1 Tax=Riccia sorocarpa TaxID=122646 RepID=A0ABD3I722_9MARC
MDQFNEASGLDQNHEQSVDDPNVWIVTMPFFSHVVSASRLARQISRQGISVTLFGAKDDIRRLETIGDRDLTNWSQEASGITVRSLEISSTKLADTVGGGQRILGPVAQAVQAFEQILTEALDENSTSKPTYVIIDFLLPAALSIAFNLKVPACPFIPFSAGFVATNYYVKRLALGNRLAMPDSFAGMDSEVQQEVISLPGLPLMRMCDVNPISFKDSPVYELGWKLAGTLEKADVLLLSGFHELEPRAYEELTRMLNPRSGCKNGRTLTNVWPIGPLFDISSDTEQRSTTVTEGIDEEAISCIKFLDSHPPSSVVYVAFGTDLNLRREQIQELAYGLESSQRPFLCVLHPPKKSSLSEEEVQDAVSVIPEDCLARIGDKGMFAKWAPQMDVLSHPSTGAFMSHCGYNSVVETVCLGVPILAWPFQYDQFMNCRHLVDGVEISMEVSPGLLPGGLVDRMCVEKSITTLFESEEGLALRNRCLEMKQRAQMSVGAQGSSTRNMEALVALIKGLAKLNLSNSS